MKRECTVLVIAALLPVLGTFTACRGETSNKPPIHIVKDMDFQAKLIAQSASSFPGFADHRSMRTPVPGTVARGSLGKFDPDRKLAKLHVFKDPEDKYVTSNPLPLSIEVMQRGRERYDINCAVCHGRTGRGVGIVGIRLDVRPPSFLPKADDDNVLTRHDERVLSLSDGEVFETITAGRATMPSYALQVSVRDRWAIIHYIRALQYRAKN